MTKQVKQSKTLLGLSIFFILLLFFSACQENKLKDKQASNSSIKDASIHHIQDSCKNLLEDGDIVLRKGNDVISGLLLNMNTKSQRFSHCGITFHEGAHWYIYHSIGGEENPDEKLNKEEFDSFINPKNNHAFGICKIKMNPEQLLSLQETVHDYYKRAIPFDMKFDIKTDDRFYCAEMVYKAFGKAMHNDSFFTITKHPRFDYVATDDIFLHKDAQLLCHIVY